MNGTQKVEAWTVYVDYCNSSIWSCFWQQKDNLVHSTNCMEEGAEDSLALTTVLSEDRKKYIRAKNIHKTLCGPD